MDNVVKIFDNTLEYIPADKGLNYIVCDEFNEVFFGVYQITINGAKFIGEGVDTIKGAPIVKIPVIIEGREHDALFALKSTPDETGIVINVNSLSNGRQIVLDEKKAVEKIAEELDIEPINEAVEETTVTNESISVDIERYKKDALRVISENFKEKKAKLEDLQETLKEFISENVNEIKQSTRINLDEFKAGVINTVETIVESNKINTDSSIAEINDLKENISILVNGYIADLELTSSEKVAALDELREQVNFEVSTQLNDFENRVNAYKQYTEDEFKKLETYIIESEKNLTAQNQSGLEASKIILDSVVEKTTDIEKFVASKITAIQSFTDKKAASIAKILENKLSEFDSKTKIVDEKVDLIEKTLSEKVVDYIGEFTAAVNEKFSGIDTIKADIESIGENQTLRIQQIGKQLIEAVETKVKNVNLVAVKKEDLNSLKKQLEDRINTESANLKKYVAGYGGGGAVAQQFAAGGTMNGDLNVNGRILSGGVDLVDIFTGGGGSGYQTLTFTESSAQLTIAPFGNTVSLSALSGGSGSSGEPIFTSWAQTYSSNYESTYSTVQANSASWGSGGSGVDTGVRALTANWQSTYTTVSSNSASWLQTLSYSEGSGLLGISNGNTVSLSSLSGGYQTLSYNSSTGQLTISPQGNSVIVSTASSFNTNYIDFNYSLTANPDFREARLFYDNDYNALTVYTEITGVSFRLGRDMGIIGVNKTGSPIVKGTVVYLSGTQGAQRPKMWPALATTDLRSADTIGLTMHDVTDNNEGYIMTIGELDGIDTTSVAAGTTLYLSPISAGKFTDVKPVAPQHLVKIGYSLNSTNNGRIYVEIDNGYELDELHNVRINGIQNGQTLIYNSLSSIWVNTTPYTSYLPLSGGTLTGTVSTNQDIEITDSTKGIILRSPSNLKYRVTVNDAGELVTTLV